MIKAMLGTDWLRLILALTFTGLLLYYNNDLTRRVADWLSINNHFGYQHELIRWVLLLISISFLGIATNRKYISEALYIGVLTAGLYFLKYFIFKV